MLKKHYITIGLVLAILTAGFLLYCPFAQTQRDNAKQYFGYTPAPEETAAFVASLPTPTISHADPKLFKADKTDTFLYRALAKAYKETYGVNWVPHNQGIGDCISHGFAHAADVSLAVDWSIGKSGSFKSAATESIYGGSRVEARGVTFGGWSDGSYGGAAAKWLKNWGVIYREKYADHDLTVYDSSRAKNWGAYGNGGKDDGGKLDTTAKQHPIHDVTLVRSFDEAAIAIQSGFPVAVCSGQGFNSTRDSEGFCRAQGSWAHCLLPGTIVSTLTPKEAQDVVIGDMVVTHKGRLRPVSQVMIKQYSGDVSRLILGGCTDVMATRGHPVLVFRPQNKEHWAKPGETLLSSPGIVSQALADKAAQHNMNQPQWIDIADVAPGDYMLVPDEIEFSGIDTPQWTVNTRCKHIPVTLAPDDDIAFLFGAYIADGSAVEDHKVSIVTSSTDTHLARLVLGFKKMGLSPRVQDFGAYSRVTVDSSIVANDFREWFGTSSVSKRVPGFLMNGEWNLQSLFDGYIAGDGTETSSGRERFTTVSESLGHQMWLIAIHLRLWPLMSNKVNNHPGQYANAKDSLIVDFSRKEPSRKTTRYWNGYYCIPVRSVDTFDYHGAVYNYDVAEDDSYVASGVIHHNCMAFVGVRHGARPGLLCQNSWANYVSGPKFPSDQPDGSFWVDAAVATRMLSGGDSFAVSGAEGFKFRDLRHGDWASLQPSKNLEIGEAHYALAP